MIAAPDAQENGAWTATKRSLSDPASSAVGLVIFLTAQSVGVEFRGSFGFGASLSQEEHKVAGGRLHVRWLRSGQRDSRYTRNSG
jgi:hypothetical protein